MDYVDTECRASKVTQGQRRSCEKAPTGLRGPQNLRTGGPHAPRITPLTDPEAPSPSRSLRRYGFVTISTTRAQFLRKHPLSLAKTPSGAK